MFISFIILIAGIAEFTIRELLHSGFLIIAPLLFARALYRNNITYSVIAALLTVVLLFIQAGSLVPGIGSIALIAVIIIFLKQLMHGEAFPVGIATLTALLFQIIAAYRELFFSYPNIAYTFLEICVTLCIVFLIESIGSGRRDNRSW